MPDVAELGVRVTLDGAQAAATGLDNLTASADKAEASTQRATSAFSATEQAVMKMGAEVQEAYRYWQQGEASLDDERLLRRVGVIGATTDALYKQAAAERAETEAAVQALSAQAQVSEIYTANRSIVLQHMQALETDASAYRYSESVIAAHVEALQLDAIANTEAAAAANGHAISLGRVNMELGTATGRILGLNPAMTRFGAMLGGSLGGYLPMIALTVAIVAAGEAWKHFTEEARKAQEQQDKNTESLKKWYEEQANGGKRAQEVAAAQNDLIDKQKKLADLQSQQGVTDFSSTRNLQRANDLKQQIATLRAAIAEDQRMIAAGAGDVQKTQSEAFDQQMQRHSQALAEELKFHQDDANLRKQALAQLQQDQALEAQFRKAGLIERAADYARMVKQLDDALNPKEKSPGAAPKETNPVILGLQKQLEEMRKVAEEENIANVQRSYSIRLVGTEGEYRAILLAQEHAEIETIKAYHELSGIALQERLATIEADKQAAVAVAVLTEKQREYLQMLKDVAAIGRRNEATAKEEIDAAAKKVKDAQAYHDQLETIARTSIERILSHGMKSWQDFFGDVLKGFESMMHAMEAEAKKHNTNPGGAGYTALQYGTIAVSSALAGYDIAKQTGNRAESVIGGAASGAEMGSFAGAPGMFIGAMAGTIGALVGLHKSASEVADDLRKMQLAQDQVALSLAQWRAQITGTAADQKAAAQLALKVQYEQLIQTIESTEAGKKQEEQRNKDLSEAAKLYADAQAKLTSSTNALTDSMLNAVQGYKYQAAIFGAAPAHAAPLTAPVTGTSGYTGSTGATSGGGSGGDLTVHVTLPDGSTLATAVLRDFKKRAGQQGKVSTQWSQIQ